MKTLVLGRWHLNQDHGALCAVMIWRRLLCSTILCPQQTIPWPDSLSFNHKKKRRGPCAAGRPALYIGNDAIQFLIWLDWPPFHYRRVLAQLNTAAPHPHHYNKNTDARVQYNNASVQYYYWPNPSLIHTRESLFMLMDYGNILGTHHFSINI